MVKKKTFEDALNTLEEIVAKMDTNEVPLDELVKLYIKGVERANFCSSKLSEAENKITMIKQNSQGTFEETDFEPEE